jgi:hypothetical protein
MKSSWLEKGKTLSWGKNQPGLRMVKKGIKTHIPHFFNSESKELSVE